MAALMSGKVLKLLGGSSDEEVLAGLTILAKMKAEDQPKASDVANALSPSFLVRLINTANNTTASSPPSPNNNNNNNNNNSYYSLSFNVWAYILSTNSSSVASAFSVLHEPVFALFKRAASPASPLPSQINQSIASAVSNLTISTTLTQTQTPSSAVSSNILGLLARVEPAKKTAQDLTAWEATSLHEVLAACDTFVSECLLSKPSTVSTASVSLFVSNR